MQTYELLENEIADKKVRNYAIRMWQKVRPLLVDKWMEHISKADMIQSLPLYVIVIHDRKEPLGVGLSWRDKGRPAGLFNKSRSENGTFLNLILVGVDFDDEIKTDAISLAKFLDRYYSIFLHEFVHYLDSLRYQNSNFLMGHANKMAAMDRLQRSNPGRTSEIKQFQVYAGSPSESNAFYHQLVAAYLTNIRLRKISRPTSANELVNQISTMRFKGVLARGFIKRLPVVYQRKWLRRLASLYTERFAAKTAA